MGSRNGCCMHFISIEVSMIMAIFAAILYFANQLVIRHEKYLICYAWFIVFHAAVVFFSVYIHLVLTTNKTHYGWAIGFFLGWICLIGLSIYISYLIIQLEYPKEGDMIEARKNPDSQTVFGTMAREIRQGKDPFLNIQTLFQCCGYNNYTDWQDLFPLPAKGPPKDYNTIISSCCVHKPDCGDHFYSLFPRDGSIRSDPTFRGPKIHEIIYITPCKTHVIRVSNLTRIRMLVYMVANILILIFVAVAFYNYFWEDAHHSWLERRRHKHTNETGIVSDESDKESEENSVGRIGTGEKT